ncbi:MAG: A/G-specific adenine glycosylase, partial [Mesorhizobium sp.]
MAPADQTRKAQTSRAKADDTASRLVAWYDAHHRELPWRVTPREHARGVRPDPYRIW